MVSNKIIGIFKVGSWVNPIIKTPQDKDCLVVIKDILTENEINELKLWLKYTCGESEIDYNIILRFEKDFNYYNNYCEFNFPPFFIYSKIEKIFGNLEYTYYNILEHKNAYIKSINNLIEHINRINKINIYKNYYHILTIIYTILNNSEELTEEQINNINYIHNNYKNIKSDDKMKSLINYCKEKLKELSNDQ